jgi:hypothetical protein
MVAGGIFDFAEGSLGESGEPVDIAAKKIQGLEPSDSLKTVGYPESDPRSVAVVRDGENVAVVTYFGDGSGGWLLVQTSSCESSGLDFQT